MTATEDARLAVWNETLRLVGEQALTGLTEDVPKRYVISSAYDRVILNVLQMAFWNFATQSSTITGTSNAIPGYAYRFAKPTAWVRTILISTSPLMNNEADYRDEGGYIYANVPTLYIRCMCAPATVLDELNWPESFKRTVAGFLSAEICETLTQSDNKKQSLLKEAIARMQKAENVDTMNTAAIRLQPGSWVRAMRRGGRSRDSGGTLLPENISIDTVGDV